MSSRWTGFFVWALVAASAAFWGLKIFSATRPVPPGAQAPQAVAANGPMERLFGAVLVPTAAAAQVHPESERFQLVGVIAAPDGAAGSGFAVVTIDAQPARTYPVGRVLDGNTTLLAVTKRGAEFGPSGGPTAFSLQLPDPAPAETGTLPTAVSQTTNGQQPGSAVAAASAQQPGNSPQFVPQVPGQVNVPNPVPGHGGMRGPGHGGANGGGAPSRAGQPPVGTTEAPPLQQ
jgi:general secretion pathway protein C